MRDLCVMSSTIQILLQENPVWDSNPRFTDLGAKGQNRTDNPHFTRVALFQIELLRHTAFFCSSRDAKPSRGASDTNRTCDILVGSQILCLAELQTHVQGLDSVRSSLYKLFHCTRGAYSRRSRTEFRFTSSWYRTPYTSDANRVLSQ